MKKQKQIEDLIDIEDSTLRIEDINNLFSDKKKYTLYKNKYKNKFYSTILRTITHETYEEKYAEEIVKDIFIHLKELNEKLNRDVGVVVATIDYLSNIKNIMNEPKIIEEVKSEFITDTSTKDDLTGLYLRDIFDVFLKKSIEEIKIKNKKLSLLMIDIDDFKKVNDNYGHQKGDEVLSIIGEILNKTIREMDFAARYGGEELSVIMPYISSSNAYYIAERIRKNISKYNFGEFKVTVSIGIGTINKKVNSCEKLIKVADDALYKVKNSGKNKVLIFDEIDN